MCDALWDSAGDDESVTVNFTVKPPATEYVWLGFAAVLVAPSPKAHSYV